MHEVTRKLRPRVEALRRRRHLPARRVTGADLTVTRLEPNPGQQPHRSPPHLARRDAPRMFGWPTIGRTPAKALARAPVTTRRPRTAPNRRPNRRQPRRHHHPLRTRVAHRMGQLPARAIWGRIGPVSGAMSGRETTKQRQAHARQRRPPSPPSQPLRPQTPSFRPAARRKVQVDRNRRARTAGPSYRSASTKQSGWPSTMPARRGWCSTPPTSTS
jgi:hypothetical protein